MESLRRVALATVLMMMLLSASWVGTQAQDDSGETNDPVAAEVTQEAEATPLPEATPEPETSEASAGTLAAVGSGIALPLLEDLAAASAIAENITFDVTGTDAGLDAFCTGEAQIAATSRAITVDEDARCINNEVEYIELLLGHSILTVIRNPEQDLNVCLTQADLTTLFAPSATGRTLDWTTTSVYVEPTPEAETPDSEATPDPEATPEAEADGSPLPLSVFVPEFSTLSYAQLDERVAGDGIRSDATLTTMDAIIQAVSDTPGALGVVSLQAAQEAGDIVTNFQLRGEAGCQAPNVSAVENGIYEAADRLFVYVNQANIADLTDLLALFADVETGSQLIVQAGFTPPTTGAFITNGLVIAGDLEGRQFSALDEGFEVPETLLGEIAIGGAPHVFSWVQRVTDSLGNQQANLTINTFFEGEAAGLRRMCNGELDVVFAYDEASEERREACAANDINEIYSLSLGHQAAVLVANAQDTYAFCLTPQELETIWGAPSGGEVENWSQVGEAFPDQAMTLFGAADGAVVNDLLLIASSDPVLPVRADTEENSDPLFRAAATANVGGALTYMMWPEYQRVQRNGQQNIQLVSVDAGEGCVAPSLETIADESYPLTREAVLLAPQEALTNINVQSFIWTLFEDVNFGGLTSANFVGLDFTDLQDVRAMLELDFAFAQEAVNEAREAAAAAENEAEAEAETTAEPDAETTAEPDAE